MKKGANNLQDIPTTAATDSILNFDTAVAKDVVIGDIYYGRL